MTDLELEQAHDDRCPDCSIATSNSNDGGELPCHFHKAKWLSRDVLVIRTTGLMDGDWTHTAVDTNSLQAFVTGILEEFQDSSLTVSDFVHNLGMTVETMPKDELEKVPEL